MKMNKTTIVLLSLGAITLPANAGTFANITIDGNFSDWSTIPIAYTDANEGFTMAPDINTIQFANNATDFFIRITYNQAINPNAGSGLYFAFDTDETIGTGFNIYGLSLLGSEVAYQNNTPFQQALGNFNTGAANSGAGITISDFNTVTLAQEFQISRSAVINTATGALLFPNNSFNFTAYTDAGANTDVAGVAGYSFAVPEPSSVVLLGVFAMAGALRRRRVAG